MLKCNSCYISVLVLTCFRLTKGRATFFRPETIVASFLHLMVLFSKWFSTILVSCYFSALVLTCFRLTKSRATFFRPETTVVSFLHLMVLFSKWFSTILGTSLLFRHSCLPVFAWRRVVLHFFDPKQLLRVSCILWRYFQSDFQEGKFKPVVEI